MNNEPTAALLGSISLADNPSNCAREGLTAWMVQWVKVGPSHPRDTCQHLLAPAGIRDHANTHLVPHAYGQGWGAESHHAPGALPLPALHLGVAMGWLLPIQLRMAHWLLQHSPAGSHVPLR